MSDADNLKATESGGTKYAPPQAVRLNEATAGCGCTPCQPGSSAEGRCNPTGSSAEGNCNTGYGADATCRTGSAAGSCSQGTGL